MRGPVFNGTQQESFELVAAIHHNCTCEFGPSGARITTCSPHQMLIEDQRALNGLLFARHFAAQFLAQEFA